ncbi:unnamed protein product [Withania somnifera]
MDLNDLNKVWEVKPLKKVCDDEAREILETVAKRCNIIQKEVERGGAKVKLRLRRPNNEWNFYPYTQILDTMLHELCQDEYGPRNADFYNLLDEIRKKTVAAAENRARVEVLLPPGTKHLEGDGSIKTIQAAAMAAERRLHDELWCGSKMLGSEGPSECPKASRIPESRHISVVGTDSKCCVCTLLNQPLALLCGACGTPKDRGNEVKAAKVWSCKFCTLENSHKVERCLACGKWRYSYGPPVSMTVPRIGT